MDTAASHRGAQSEVPDVKRLYPQASCPRNKKKDVFWAGLDLVYRFKTNISLEYETMNNKSNILFI